MSEALKILITNRIKKLDEQIEQERDRQDRAKRELETTMGVLAGHYKERDELQAVLDGIYAREMPA